MASIKHLLVLSLVELMVSQVYATFKPEGAYVFLTNHPGSVNNYVYLSYSIGPEGKSTNYEIRHNKNGCYNITNFVVKSIGSMGNHDWLEVTYGEDCVTGRIIDEHRMTQEEPFSVYNVYWYKRYSDDPENPPTCIPVNSHYHVIFTLSKDPDENVKQMIQNYVEENHIGGLQKADPHECDSSPK